MLFLNLNTHLYNSVAILVASEMFLQSINQNRAETVVVNETQSFTKVSGVEPVTSSHCAREGPPKSSDTYKKENATKSKILAPARLFNKNTYLIIIVFVFLLQIHQQEHKEK